MKFSCDSCGAQYMISDEKIGANGVKVRCKKCKNVIVLRRAPAEVPGPSTGAAAKKERGLDEELGQAFDAAFGGGEAAAEQSARNDIEATQLMGADDLAKLATGQAEHAAAPEPAAEWYVAIRDTQVGPLATAAVKEKWQAGEIGPDTLVWKPGMADWSRLSSVGELSNLLAPLPRPSSAPRVERSRQTEAKPAAEARAGPADGGSADADWKPSAASALAALASDEISARAPTPQRKNHAGAVPANGARSLIDAMNLPDGGVDPTGAIPLQIKGGTGESTLKHKSSVARDSDEVRLRRHTSRMIAVVSVILVVLFGGGIAYVVYTLQKIEASGGTVASNAPGTVNPAAADSTPARAPAAVKPAPPSPPPAARQPAASPPPAPSVPAAPPPRPAVAAAPPPRTTESARVKPPPPPRVQPPPKPVRERVADARPPRTEEDVPDVPDAQRKPPRGSRRASAAAAPADDDKAFRDILEGSSDGKTVESGGRHVYVPGSLGNDDSLPDSVSSSQITEAVAGRLSALQNCISEQKARGGEGGTLKMGWSIAPDGGTRNVRCLSPEFSSQPFAKCISNVVKSVRFPKSKSGKGGVEFPFKF